MARIGFQARPRQRNFNREKDVRTQTHTHTHSKGKGMKCAFESIYEQSESKAWPSSSPSFTQSPSAVAVITAIASRLRAAIVVAAARHADDNALKVVDPVYEPLVGDLFACLTPGSSGARELGGTARLGVFKNGEYVE